MEKIIDYCKRVCRTNAAIVEIEELRNQLFNDLRPFYDRRLDDPPIFSKPVNFNVKASHGHDYNPGFVNLLINRLEIRPSFDNGDSRLFCFSLMLVLIAENQETFWFRIARTNTKNLVGLPMVQCQGDNQFIIENKGGAYVQFFSQTDFMDTINFCYDSLDSFNEKSEEKLMEHMLFLCEKSFIRSKNRLLPTGYLAKDMKVQILYNGERVSQAIVSEINETLLDHYPGNKLVKVTGCSDYFPRKEMCLIFVSRSPEHREGWYPAVEDQHFDFSGPVYEVKPV